MISKSQRISQNTLRKYIEITELYYACIDSHPNAKPLRGRTIANILRHNTVSTSFEREALKDNIKWMRNAVRIQDKYFWKQKYHTEEDLVFKSYWNAQDLFVARNVPLLKKNKVRCPIKCDN